MMHDVVFKPKYPLRFLIGVIFVFPFEAFMIWDVFSKQDISFETIFGPVFFGVFILLMPVVFIRRIVFEGQTFTIEKYLLPAKTIDYSDVVDIGNTIITTRQGNIPLQAMKNSQELKDLLMKFLSDGKTNRYQIENRLVGQEKLGRKAAIPASIITTIIWIASFFIFPYEKSLLRDSGFFLIVWVPIYLLIYQFMKNRAENQ
jgi:hypothetical protein